MAYDLSIENEIQSELQDGEQLLWQGKPNPNRLLSKYDIFMVPFSILWFGAVLFGFIKTRDNGFFPFDIMLLFFCIVGAYITIGRFLLKRSRRKKTIYLLTDKRAVEIFAASRRKVKSVYYNQMSGLNHTSRSDGSGTIIFVSSNTFQEMYAESGMDFGMSQSSGYPAFYHIERVDEPLKMIQQRLGAASTQS